MPNLTPKTFPCNPHADRDVCNDLDDLDRPVPYALGPHSLDLPVPYRLTALGRVDVQLISKSASPLVR